MDDCLSDLRPYAANDAVRAHQSRRRDRFQEVLRGQRVDGGNSGDIDDSNRCALINDGLKEILHHHLRALTVKCADDRKSKYPFPQSDDRRGKLCDLALLAKDHALAGFLIDLTGVKSEFVQEQRDRPSRLSEEGWRQSL